MSHPQQAINLSASITTLDALFRARVALTPDCLAYRAFSERSGDWQEWTWRDIDDQVTRWQFALHREGLQPGDRVAVMLRNSPEWVIFDQAALGLGLVVVPLYTQDRADNAAYILNNAECKVLLIEGNLQWHELAQVMPELTHVLRVLSVGKCLVDHEEPRLRDIASWLADIHLEPGQSLPLATHRGEDLATIVYTSGTTGRPKGVMLSHHNILTNINACLVRMTVTTNDVFMSFLPLSHMFERTCGYYLAMMAGSVTAYARSIQLLADDFLIIKPTLLISVPRIYERILTAIRAKLEAGPTIIRWLFMHAVEIGYSQFEYQQGRADWQFKLLWWPLMQRLVAKKVLARLGGRLRCALSGGAALQADIARVFIGLGVPILQGYGLTETSPVACANDPVNNIPESVGQPLRDIQIRIGDQGAVWIKGPNVMLGYWRNESATRAVLNEGWFNSGDTGRIGEQGHLYITGRLKEIIVLSSGEKVPPTDMELAIARDTLFEQLMIIGEGRSYLSLIAVLHAEQWRSLAQGIGVDPDADMSLQAEAVVGLVIERIAAQVREFPGYANVRRVILTREPWTIENGFLTPTLKLKRQQVLSHFALDIERIYSKPNKP